jgi:hypothetical protein
MDLDLRGVRVTERSSGCLSVRLVWLFCGESGALDRGFVMLAVMRGSSFFVFRVLSWSRCCSTVGIRVDV